MRGEKLCTLTDLARNLGDVLEVSEVRARLIDTDVIPSFRTPGNHVRVRVKDVAPSLAKAAIAFDVRSKVLTDEQRSRAIAVVARELQKRLDNGPIDIRDADHFAAHAIEDEIAIQHGWTPDELLSSREDMGAW